MRGNQQASLEGHQKRFLWVFALSVFFRGFRGHHIRHHQIEKALADCIRCSPVLLSGPIARKTAFRET
jgi:hypothetical protein